MRVQDAIAGSLLHRFDAEVLLARALRVDRSWLMAHGQDELPAEAARTYLAWVERRRAKEPVAYITGMQEFYGRPFSVDRRVLIPRGSTEDLTRIALEFLRDGKERGEEVDTGISVTARRTANAWAAPSLVAEIGTGSGAVAVTIALERPDLRVLATDISGDALEVARNNAGALGARNVTFLEGDGPSPLELIAEPFVLVTNPPYIPSTRTLMKDVQDYEPHVALFGGEDGSDLIRAVRDYAAKSPWCLGVVMECHTGQ